MSIARYDVLVLGVGGTGAAALAQLAGRGVSVVGGIRGGHRDRRDRRRPRDDGQEPLRSRAVQPGSLRAVVKSPSRRFWRFGGVVGQFPSPFGQLRLSLANVDSSRDALSAEHILCVEEIVRTAEDPEIRWFMRPAKRPRLHVVELEQRARRAATALVIQEGTLLAVASEDLAPSRVGDTR